MNQPNPYAPPGASSPARTDVTPLTPLFGYGSIAVATIVGSVLGGGLLLAMNFHAMGRPISRLLTIVGAALTIPITISMTFLLPLGRISPLVIWCAWLTITLVATRVLQSRALAARQVVGIGTRPVWLAFGLGLLVSLALAALSTALMMVQTTVQLPG